MILHFIQHNMMAEGRPGELAEFIKVLGETESGKAEEPSDEEAAEDTANIAERLFDCIIKTME